MASATVAARAILQARALIFRWRRVNSHQNLRRDPAPCEPEQGNGLLSEVGTLTAKYRQLPGLPDGLDGTLSKRRAKRVVHYGIYGQ
jgi:hypothetical protein